MIIYRYLLKHFLSVLILCICSFVAILLSTRLDEIAHFAALGAPIGIIGKFALFQVPYVLPIVIPISSLISAVILIQRLSTSHELTALRAGGFSLRQILTPILLAASVISVLNFYLISEVATRSHLATRQIEHDLGSINPLHLMRHKHIHKIKDFFIHTFAPTESSHSVQDVVVAIWDNHHKRLNLLTAKSIDTTDKSLVGHHVTTITTFDAHPFDNLVVENIETMETSIDYFSQFLKKKVWRLQHADYLRTSLLRLHSREGKKLFKDLDATEEQKKDAKRQITKSRTEIFRRISISLAVFSFTLMGISFGMSIGRARSSRGILILVLLATFFLVSYFMAKGFNESLYTSAVLYLLPHPIIIGASILALSRVSRGIE